MAEVGKLLATVLREVPALVLRPWAFPLFWVVVGLTYLQYSRIAEQERRIYGVVKNDARRHCLWSALYGLCGGVLASLLMALLGISLAGVDVSWLLGLALLLMAISPRLMCFSYAGGIVALSHLVLGWPEVYIPSLMALVGVLHVTESALIFVRGAACATPLTVRGHEGGVRTGFLLQGFWPLPLLVLFVAALPPGASHQGLLAMPSWWPVLVPPPEVVAQENAVFILAPVAAVLGYSDLAARLGPLAKARRSAGLLMAYSLFLLGLCVVASHYPSWVWLPALWGPLGHEVVVRLGSRGEFRERAALGPDPEGLTILDVLPGSGAAEAGLRSGDVLVSVDGLPARDEEALASLTRSDQPWITADVRRGEQRFQVKLRRKPAVPGGSPVIGIIPFPPEGAVPQAELHNRGYLWRWFERLMRRGGPWARDG